MPRSLSVTARIPYDPLNAPPVLLVHGAGASTWVWNAWQIELAARGFSSFAVTLRGHRGNETQLLNAVRMEDYVDDVNAVARQLKEPPIIMGWGTGGLVALLETARDPRTAGLVLLAPSPPLAVQGAGAPGDIAAIPDVFGPEAYGIGRTVAESRGVLQELTEEEAAEVVRLVEAESGLARRQRRMGVNVPAAAVRCPVLVVSGSMDRQFPPTVCRSVAALYSGDYQEVAGAGHWGIVVGRKYVESAAPEVARWLTQRFAHER